MVPECPIHDAKATLATVMIWKCLTQHHCWDVEGKRARKCNLNFWLHTRDPVFKEVANSSEEPEFYSHLRYSCGIMQPLCLRLPVSETVGAV